MAEAKIRFFLHSRPNRDGTCAVYMNVSVGESRPVRQAVGVLAHPAVWADSAPHLDKRTDGYRAYNERFEELRLFVRKLVRRLDEDGQLTNEAVAGPLKAQVASYTGKPLREPKAAELAPVAAVAVPLAEQPLRAVYERWREDNSAEFSKEYLAAGNQYMDWMEKFDPRVTPARVDAAWVKRYTKFLVEDTPLYNNTIHQHINRLRVLLQLAGLPTKWLKNKWKHEIEKCYLTWEELQQLHAWQPPASRAFLQRQKDVFIVRCLTGLRYSDSLGLLRPHIRTGGTNNVIRLDQQKTRAMVQVPVLAMAQEILDRYQEEAGFKALPVVSRQRTGDAIKEILQLAGIEAPYIRVRYKGTQKIEDVRPKWQAASTHTARHTFGTLMARMGLDPFTIRDFMGHTDMKSTMIYVHLEAHHAEKSMVEGFNQLASGQAK